MTESQETERGACSHKRSHMRCVFFTVPGTRERRRSHPVQVCSDCGAVASLHPTRAKSQETERLRAALEPFARIADLYDDRQDDRFEMWQDAHERDTRINLGQCRAARAALSALHPEQARAPERCGACWADVGCEHELACPRYGEGDPLHETTPHPEQKP